MARAGGAGQPWRASLEDTLTGERRGFADLEALVAYLHDTDRRSVLCQRRNLAGCQTQSDEEEYHATPKAPIGNVQRPADGSAAGRLCGPRRGADGARLPTPPCRLPTPLRRPQQSPIPSAVVQAWADAINSGDVDAALDLFTDDGKYLIGYTAYGKEPMRWVFNWLAGLETKWEILDCQPQDDTIACNLTVLDGCIAVSASPGLPIKAMFTLQDGKIKEAAGSGTGPEWNAYWDFVSIVRSWERVFRPEEWPRSRGNL